MPVFDYQGAKSAGYSDDDIAQFLQQQKFAGVDMYIPKDQYEAIPQKKKGFVRNLAEGIVRPFARAAVTTVKAAEGTANLVAYGAARAMGDKEHAQAILNANPAAANSQGKELTRTSVNLPFIGETKPVSKPLEAAGVGAEIGATLVGGSGVGNIIKAGGKGLIGRAILQGAKEGAFTGGAYGFGGAAQEDNATVGSVAKGTAVGAAGGAVVGGVAGGISAGRVVAGKAIRKSAQEGTYKALGATTKTGRAEAKKIVDGVIDRNIVATEEGLKNKASGQLEKAGQAIEDLGPLQGRSKVSDVLAPLQDELNKLKPAGSNKILPSQQYQRDVVDKIIQDFNAYAAPDGTISNEALRSIRRMYDKEVSKAGGFLGEAVKPLKEGTLLRYKKEAANSIRGTLVKSEPDLAKLNKEYSFWAGLNHLLEQKAAKATGRGQSLGQIAVQTGLAAGQTASGGAVQGGLLAVGIHLVQKATNGTFWRLLSVNAKKRISNALLTGSEEAVKKTLTKEVGRVATDDAQKFVQEVSSAAPTVVSNQGQGIVLKTTGEVAKKSVIPSKVITSEQLKFLPKEGFDQLSTPAKKFILKLEQSSVSARPTGDIGAVIRPEDFMKLPALPENIAKEVASYLQKYTFK